VKSCTINVVCVYIGVLIWGVELEAWDFLVLVYSWYGAIIIFVLGQYYNSNGVGGEYWILVDIIP
jgi:hypothetical protein